MINSNDNFKAEILITLAVLSFILLVAVIYFVTKVECYKAMANKPAIEINLVCN